MALLPGQNYLDPNLWVTADFTSGENILPILIIDPDTGNPVVPSGGSDPALEARVTALENNIYEVTYKETIDISSSTAGSITIPTGAVLDETEFPGNSILSTETAGQPDYETPYKNGVAITANLDSSGNYLASDTFDDPVTLVFRLRVTGITISNLDNDNVIEFWRNNDGIGSVGEPNIRVIKDLNDLPVPVAGVITLSESNVTYIVSGMVMLGANRIEVTGDNVSFKGNNVSADGFFSTTTGTVITANSGLVMSDMFLSSLTSSGLLNVTGTGTEVVLLQKMSFVGGLLQVSATDLRVVAINLCIFQDGVNSIEVFGTNNKNLLVSNTIFETISGVFLNLGNSEFESVGIHSTVGTSLVGTTFINVAPSGANIKTGGYGTIKDNKFNISAGGIPIVGYSPLDLEWEASGNNNITTSDRIEPTGYGNYADSETAPPTQVFNGTPSLLLIDGSGANTDTTQLPKVIRGSTELWDTTTSSIIPITEGDSYNIRILLTLTGSSGNPTRMRFLFDVGGAGVPTNVNVESSFTLRPGQFPQNYSITVPVYDNGDLSANGGRFFVQADSGTITVSTREILIMRMSSGAH